MEINVSLNHRKESCLIEGEPGMTAEEVYRLFEGEIDKPVYACSVDHAVRPLNTKLVKPCELRFLDASFKEASLIFQHSLVLLALRAAEDVAPDVDFSFASALHEGLYLLPEPRNLTDGEIEALELRMHELSEANLPIGMRWVRGQEAEEALASLLAGRNTFAERAIRRGEMVMEGVLDGYRDFFSVALVPSTGYLKDYSLKRFGDGLLIRISSEEQGEELSPETNFTWDSGLLYRALQEQREWNEILGVRYLSDISRKVDAGGGTLMIRLSEALHDKKVVDIANRITEENRRVVLILGPSSSGKTTFAKRLSLQLMVNGSHPLYVGTDDFFKERNECTKDENGEYNFEDIDAIDLPLFNRCMKELLEGREVDMPFFDFKTGTKTFGQNRTRLKENGILLIEGIHAFNPDLTRELAEDEKFRIYISPLTDINLDAHNRIPATDTRILRRMVRDNRTRDIGAAETLRMWRKVHEGECRNIFPNMEKADVFFNSVHTFEMAVLKKYAEPLLSEIEREDPVYSEAQRLLRLLHCIDGIDAEEAIGPDSILREFIGGSIFE